MIRIERPPTHDRCANTTRAKSACRAAALAAAVLGAAIWPISGAAHSMRDVEAALEAAERSAEVVDEAAPDIALAGGDGQRLALAGFRGRVVVLELEPVHATPACAPSGGPIAKVRELVTQVPGLSEQVQFITLSGDRRDAATETGEPCEQDSPGASDAPVLRARPVRGDTIADLATAFGMPPGSAIGTVVVDSEGRIRARFRGERFEPLQVMLYVAALAHGEHAPAATAPHRTRGSTSTPPWAIGSAFALLGLTGYLVAGTWRRRRRSAQDGQEQIRS